MSFDITPDYSQIDPTDDPFFIIGCVRSGTTMLRDVIASHPLLFCPNETHFFRHAEPYGTLNYMFRLLNQKLLQRHRALDGITQRQFHDDIFMKAWTRGKLMQNYGRAYLAAQKAPEGARWFDKTPQNVYGVLLIAHQFPRARFIHIVRNPLNVVASLRTSKIMEIKEVIGAVNYWLEAAIIIKSIKPLLGERLFEITYDHFTNDPEQSVAEIFYFIGENKAPITFNLSEIRPEHDRYKEVLLPWEIEVTRRLCGELAADYGFVI